jgi:hypothetical protein
MHGGTIGRCEFPDYVRRKVLIYISRSAPKLEDDVIIAQPMIGDVEKC